MPDPSALNPITAIPYRPEIDGLRALAIVPVILFHMGVSWIPGGYLGVDVFFVISGFLISSIIVHEFEQGTFSLPRFWSRRFRRILPALLTMLLITSIVSIFWTFKPDTIYYGTQGAAAALSAANLALWNQNLDYWSTTAQKTPFLHTWSLSVEEQFYLFYPLILITALRFGKRCAAIVLILVIAASYLLTIQKNAAADTATFYLLPARAWELATGCLLALAPAIRASSVAGRGQNILALLGLSLILASLFTFTGQDSFRRYLAIPVLGSALVIRYAQAPKSLARRALALPPLVFLGKRSYSLYLWHWPVIVLGDQFGLQETALLDRWITVAFILGLAFSSYQFVESPVRFGLKPTAALCVCLGLLMASLGASAYLYLRSNLYDTSMYQQAWKGDEYKVNPGHLALTYKKSKTKTPSQKDALINAYATGGIIHHHGGDVPKVVVLGDSHALMWSNVIDRITENLGITTSFYAADSISPFFTLPLSKPKRTDKGFTPEQRLEYDQKRLEFLGLWKPKVVVLVTRWEHTTLEKTRNLVEFCGKVGAKVVLIEQPPVLSFGDRKAGQYLSYLHFWPRRDERRYFPTLPSNRYEQGLQIVRSLCKEYPFCRMIDIKDLFDGPEGQAWVLDGKSLLYHDDDHLSQAGAERASDRIWDGLRSALSED